MTSHTENSRHHRFLGSIRARLMGVIALFGVALVAMVATLTWIDARDIYAGRQDELRTVIDVASKVVQQQYDEFKKGTISEAEAQQRAKASIRALRYNTDDYFFVQDKDIVTIVHGVRSDQEGLDGSKQQDHNGKYFFAEMNKVAAENGQGFVDYQYAKPGAPLDQPSPKLSYVKLFAPWQWTLGTGMYVDDIEAAIWARALWTAGTALAFLILIGGFAGLVMFRLSNRLDGLSTAMTSLASGESDVALPAISGQDEVADMARAVQVFKDNAVERARLEAEALANRSQSEIERERTAAERAKAAEEQAEVVRRLGGGLKDLAGGDLTVRLGEGFSPTYAQIRDDFNDAIDKLKTTVLTVIESAGAIKTGAQEISAASDDLSRRTEQQAASLEQTAATLSEVTSTVKKSAEGTSHARQVVTAADADAKESAAVVGQAVEAMSAIAKSSQQISQIIGVIDEIAFQTNLLALNAGVEAARAGEAGRGFAVVASEVRALAQRSAQAAKEIKALISDSAGQVEAGVKLVAETGRSLERIMTQVTEINAVVGDIAAGAQEQSTALQETNTAIEQMNLVTQQNAAMVEQSTAAGHSLSEESSRLAQLVGQFQVGRPAGDEALRHELMAAAPHAFRVAPKTVAPAQAPSKAAVARPSGAAPHRPQPVRRPAAKAVVNGSAPEAAAGGAEDGWQEF
jgi:methyl-accepting chemotaxis protein